MFSGVAAIVEFNGGCSITENRGSAERRRRGKAVSTQELVSPNR